MFFVVPLVFLVVVDSLHAWTPNHRGWADVELTDSSGKSIMTSVDTFLFPCDIKERDVFYITVENGVTEIRCGEPPE